MAHSIGYVASSQALLDPAGHAASQPAAAYFANWNPAVDNLSQDHDLLCAEMSRLAYADEATVRDSLSCPGFTTVDFLGGDDLQSRAANLGTQGFVATNPAAGITVVAFRGTESGKLEDLVADARALQKEWPQSPARAHAGFLDCYLRVRQRIGELVTGQRGGAATDRLVLLVTGHSLGAALATLAAIDLQPTALVTFGSPLVGNRELAALLGKVAVRRYVDCCDLITRVPPEKFDRDNIGRLLTELAAGARIGPARRLLGGKVIRGVARGIDKLFADTDKAPDYCHAGTLCYVDRNGAITRGSRDEERAFDQQTARGEYAQTRRPASVALRDLADHAPINYVSALAGRLPTSPGQLHTAAEVIAAERVFLDQRRETQGQPPLAADPVVRGLCLSGGGIRSATFGLGVLQALAKHGLLARFDYLSTVSGGGYIGTCLTSLLTRGRNHEKSEPWRAEIGLDGKTFPLTGLGADEPDRPFDKTRLHVRNQMHHLRTHSEFLMSHRGILSRDVLRALGQVGGGIVYTLAVYLLLLGVGVTLLHLLVSTLDPWLMLLQPKEALRLKDGLGTIAYLKAFVSEWWTQRIQTPLADIAGAADAAWNRRAFGLGLAWAVGWLLWAERKTERLATDERIDYTRQRAGWSADDEREAKVVRRFNLASLAAAVLFVGGVSLAHTWFGAAVTWYAGLALPIAFALGGLAAMLATVAHTETFRRHDNSRRDRRRRSVRGAMLGSAWLGLVAAALIPPFLVAVAALANLPFKFLEALVMLVGGYLLARKPTGKGGLFGALQVGARPVLTALTWAFLLVSAATLSEALLRTYSRSPLIASVSALAAFLVLAAALVLVGFTVDANRTSPHYFYRDRLTEAYLQTVSPVERGDGGRAQGKPVMLLRNDEDLLLRNAGVEEDSCRRRRQRGPYHLLVTALNLRGSDELNRRSFLSDHFIFSPGFVGSSLTGFARTDEYEGGQLRLARPMAISAAAVGSGVGFQTFWAQAFFATLFNARLGYWMKNPWWEAHRGTLGGRNRMLTFWPSYLLRELTGKSDARGRLINLSDGGHTGDNLGLVPLLERRCDLVVVCDAEADATQGFGSFMNAVRMAQVELDVEIDVDLGPIQRRKKQDEGYELSGAAVAFGSIRYPAARDGQGAAVPEKEGTLLYLKAAASRFAFGESGPPLPVHVVAYLRENEHFPHQSTMDQFFDDAQFESYRALGFHVADAAAAELDRRSRVAPPAAGKPVTAEPAAPPVAISIAPIEPR